MPLNLEELGQLVRTVARECHLDAEVVGVTPTEGDGLYAEVIVDLLRPNVAAERLSLGFQRDASVEDLRADIASKLDAGLGHSSER